MFRNPTRQLLKTIPPSLPQCRPAEAESGARALPLVRLRRNTAGHRLPNWQCARLCASQRSEHVVRISGWWSKLDLDQTSSRHEPNLSKSTTSISRAKTLVETNGPYPLTLSSSKSLTWHKRPGAGRVDGHTGSCAKTRRGDRRRRRSRMRKACGSIRVSLCQSIFI